MDTKTKWIVALVVLGILVAAIIILAVSGMWLPALCLGMLCPPAGLIALPIVLFANRRKNHVSPAVPTAAPVSAASQPQPQPVRSDHTWLILVLAILTLAFFALVFGLVFKPQPAAAPAIAPDVDFEVKVNVPVQQSQQQIVVADNCCGAIAATPTATLLPTLAPTVFPTMAPSPTVTLAVPTCGVCPSNPPAATYPDTLNPDDNVGITLQPGIYAIEDTSMEPTIKPDGTGYHSFYVLFVPEGKTYWIPPYAEARMRVWQFQDGSTPQGAVCEELREASIFAASKVGTSTTVMFFNIPLLVNGVLQ